MNNTIKRLISLGLILSFATGLLGCQMGNWGTAVKGEAATIGKEKMNTTASQIASVKDFQFEVKPETFELTLVANGKAESVSEPMPKREVLNFKISEKEASWTYPNENLEVKLVKMDGYLNVSVTSTQKAHNEISWPRISGESFVMPFGQGKQFSTSDQNWKTYLADTELEVSDGYAMQFFGVQKKAFGLLFILDDMYNTSVKFDTKNNIEMSYTHAFTKINKDKTYGYKIYITDHNPVTMAKLYRQDRKERGLFTTLAEKAAKQKNIEKLYGAPHIYLWEDKVSPSFLDELKKSGISKAWMGFDSWDKGIKNPEFVKKANEMGYLIGMYDSYHSIHEPGKEQWETAKFEDKTLYETGTVTKQNGKKATGFNKTGRKLNPLFSMGEVKSRMNKLFKGDMKFNSWFIDCDATGEIIDDYSPNHITTVEQDIQARLDRMAYIRDQKQLVIGSEGGNDFASQTIAFAHGIELPAFSWRDEDMSKNKQSPYYLGKYYSYRGGVAEIFAKPVPLKPLYTAIFFNPLYDVPLYKLVYNDSVITTYQWSWSTLKIKGEEKNRMMHEVLYNIPPLYHLDQRVWQANKKTIEAHHKTWAPFHEKAVQREMTDFKCLNPERTVQMTMFGNDLYVIGNFSDKVFTYEGVNITPQTVKVFDGK